MDSIFDLVIKSVHDQLELTIILQALLDIEIRGQVYRWLVQFLKDRFLFMNREDGKTSQCKLLRGISQGGVSTPTLFNIALLSIAGTIPKHVKSSSCADDTCFWTSSANRDVPGRRPQNSLNTFSTQLK